MLEAFLTFINQQKLEIAGRSTLLTVSGGMDSVVLSHLFYQAGFSACIAHCNFGLRGEESDGDELFVRNLAASYGFPFHVKKFAAKEYAQAEGVSTQMAARDLRYNWFEEIRALYHYDTVATAHHAGDSFETVILNLVRGTGLAGLHGIAVQNHRLIRPLLFATREEIRQYVADHGLDWREDSSNASNNYKRNLIRHEVVPVLKKMNPSLETTFKTTAQRLKSAEMILDDFLKKWETEAVKWIGDDLHISIDVLVAAGEAEYRLWYIVQHYGFSYHQAQEVYKSVNGLSGKIFHSSSHSILKDRSVFILTKKRNVGALEDLMIEEADGVYQDESIALNLKKRAWTKGLQDTFNNDTGHFDAEKIVFPLTVRNWIAGDRFCPLGMQGNSKKVSDLLIDLKLDRNQKQKVKVLLNGNGDIIWVIGHRMDNRYRLTSNSREVISVQEIGL
jgi:tRNA(Ile)-lysidine synthase